MSSSRRKRTRRRRRATVAGVLAAVAVLAVAWLVQSDTPLGEDLREAVARASDAADSAAGAVEGAAEGAVEGAREGADTGGQDVDGARPGSVNLGGLRPQASPEEARELLDGLAEAPTTVPGTPDYDREDYGERWADTDGNGCNQRDDVLLRDARDGTAEVAQQGSCDHDVLAGTWDGPYTGLELTFDDLKDGAQAQAISIDHVVPLAEAHRSGAGGWPAEERERFATDLDNLVATDGPTNSDKADADPADWRPPVEASWCGYAVVWVSVKDEWGLAVDGAERAGLEEMLATC